MNLMDVLKNRGVKINVVVVIAVLAVALIAVNCLLRKPADTGKQIGDKSAATVVKTEKAKPVADDGDSFDNTSKLFKKFKYVGNANSKIFHVTDGSCPTADKINPKNMVKLNSKEQARKEGYEGCEVCNP